MNYTAQYNQSLQDIALQEYGDISGVFILATDNNLSITDALVLGQVLQIDETKIIDKQTVNNYKNNKKILATASVVAYVAPSGSFSTSFSQSYN